MTMDLDDMNRRLVAMGFRPTVQNYPKAQRVYQLSDEAVRGLRELAEEHHFTWGNQPSVPKFLEALGQGLFVVQSKYATEENPHNESTSANSDLQ